MKKYVFAVVGALGNAFTELRSILETRDLTIKKACIDGCVAESWKKRCRDKDFNLVESKPEAFSGVDIAIISAGTEASLELSPEALKRGCIVIDNSTAYRMAPEHPLVITKVNTEQLVNHQGIIANPNCSTIQMLVAMKPIHDKYRVERVIVSIYQALSGMGHAGVYELQKQTLSHAKGEKIENKVYPHQIAFNILPHIDSCKKTATAEKKL